MSDGWMWCHGNPKEAAAELRRLRSALNEIADGFNGGEVAAVMLQEIARKAINLSATANEEQ